MAADCESGTRMAASLPCSTSAALTPYGEQEGATLRLGATQVDRPERRRLAWALYGTEGPAGASAASDSVALRARLVARAGELAPQSVALVSWLVPALRFSQNW